MPAKDPDQRCATQKAYYLRNRERILQSHRDPEYRAKKNAYQNRIWREKQDYIHQLKDSTPCADCGEQYRYWVMDFDHVRGQKKCDMNSMSRYSWTAIKAEIAKCEIVCANCHRDRTHCRSTEEVIPSSEARDISQGP